MLHPGSIGTVHGHGGVVEGRQQILPYIPYLSGVLFQAHEDKPQVIAVQFMSWAFTTSAGLSSPAMRMKRRLLHTVSTSSSSISRSISSSSG